MSKELDQAKRQTQNNLFRRITRAPWFQYALSTELEVSMTVQNIVEYFTSTWPHQYSSKDFFKTVHNGLYITANETSTKGVEIFLSGIYTALYQPWVPVPGGPSLPTTPIHAVQTARGALYDLKDGIRSRFPGLITWCLSKLKHEPPPNYSEPGGHLWDASRDRIREALACNACADFYLQQTGDTAGAQWFLNAGYSCGVPSIIRAYAESQGYSVSESKLSFNDLRQDPRKAWDYMKGTSFIRPSLIYLMAHELGQGRLENGLILADYIYTSNMGTAAQRIDRTNWKTLPQSEDRHAVIQEGGVRMIGLFATMEEITQMIEGDMYQQNNYQQWLNQQPGFDQFQV